MKVTFWGVRGSIPTPGDATCRWGGNSSCVVVQADGEMPLVLDCGTGARPLGHELMRSGRREVTVLFSHLHADHVFGFPFFLPLYTPGWKVRVGVPSYSPDEAREKIGRYLNGTFHPTRLRDVPAELTFEAIRAKRAPAVEGYDILPVRLHHPGGAMGYLIRHGGRSVAYITDTSPFAKPGEGVAADGPPTPAERRMLEALRGCDLVVYDTMYDYEEYLEKMTWGHSYPEYAMALCREAGVKRLVLFHHLPDASDDDLDARAARYAHVDAPRVSLAREGQTLTV